MPKTLKEWLVGKNPEDILDITFRNAQHQEEGFPTTVKDAEEDLPPEVLNATVCVATKLDVADMYYINCAIV